MDISINGGSLNDIIIQTKIALSKKDFFPKRLQCVSQVNSFRLLIKFIIFITCLSNN